MRALLGLTQGNLGVHLQKLEEAGYISVRKQFVKRKPLTTCSITRKGRGAFLRHVGQLERIVRSQD